ncbi:hypothetical protein LZ012_18485 [Dechloromonas sp. XY25]|uniref:Uncharacterized protein n=1 Tax=Dechloromonas hankyongensis TaxID=2908002 RepID=A0ABS9K740_9RHOO|nr:hypothetical protein [Dechloromonas hankyongensis]MCG2578984.1 hypothetical protein [Dechloromonas hankyongensis]
MAFVDNLPVSESLGVFVGITGYDWLAEGQAEPVKAAIAAIAAGGIIAIARVLLKHRKKG